MGGRWALWGIFVFSQTYELVSCGRQVRKGFYINVLMHSGMLKCILSADICIAPFLISFSQIITQIYGSKLYTCDDVAVIIVILSLARAICPLNLHSLFSLSVFINYEVSSYHAILSSCSTYIYIYI